MAADYNALMILGPTAAGKTRLAALLAAKLDAEIISADSRQVYRGMDIGSGKDLADYIVDGNQVPYHCINIADPTEEYTVFSWQQEAYHAFSQIVSRGRVPLICGGTGMYLDSIVRKYAFVVVPPNETLRAELATKSMEELQQYLRSLKTEHIHDDLYERPRLVRAIEIAVSDAERTRDGTMIVPDTPVIQPFIIGIRFDRADLQKRIQSRLWERLDNGLIEEVEKLLASGVSVARLERFGLEYRFVSEFLRGVIPSKEFLKERLFVAIRQFAKRQDTWFRGMERKGVPIHWIEVNAKTTATMLSRSLALVESVHLSKV